VFYDESPRTQYSFAAAMQRLGGSVISLNQYEKENLTDTVRMMSSYSDCLIFKHSDKNAIQMAVDNSNVPVVNAGDENPTQALVDLFTIREEIGHISGNVLPTIASSRSIGIYFCLIIFVRQGITITLVGDLKNTLSVHALAKLIGQYSDVTIQYVAPDALKMPQAIRDYLQDRCQQIECKTVEEAIVSTDVLYMTGLGRKMFSSSNEYRQYQLTAKQMRLAKDKMIVMHSMPRGDEINIKIDTDNRAAYLRQAAYSLDIRMALLFSILKDH
jgi:carbamoyl-phosphate synthase/aspartate carbamoyltransferase/dihydroorotase